ncbi:MAG TPA: bifunctional 3,4-dihydroxy-2-butanone-4-phosphate synthase/GTP cyclohydrolase II [Candidatus Krumholzibacteria bacterium]|nr:bifunctional 3,4-dihydroxy-2-butanone-4-phosphate synthase/GTP cyclohydrolase II [Candidatus Krumholzibacteria bacterium]
MSNFCSIETAVEAIRNGEIIIVVDDADRENEGDMILAAEKVTPAKINYLARYGRGLICAPITDERAGELQLDPMVPENTCRLGTAFTVSIDLAGGTTTGISAHDRSATVAALVDPATRPDDFMRPGHVFPLVAKAGGVLRRAGHTEAAVDLARMAGLSPAGVLCEVLDDDGSMARLPRLLRMAEELGLKIVTIADLIAYRRRTEKLVEKVRAIHFPSEYGEFTLHLYRSLASGHNHIALTCGEIRDDDAVLVRVHSQCFTGDVLGSLRCDCGPQLHRALTMISEEGRGVLLYMNQEGRGIGLENKIHAYALQDEGRDTVEANEELGFPPDLRDYGVGAQILSDLGVGKIRLLTNNPKKVIGLSAHGLDVVDRVPIEIEANEVNRRYLAAKRDKMGHLLTQVLSTPAGRVRGMQHAE